MAQSFADTEWPVEFFEFSGQAVLEVWTLKDVFQEDGWCRYEDFLKHEPELCFQRIRELVDAFPTWQRQPATGRRRTSERTLLIALMVRQLLRSPYRQLRSFLRILRGFFRIRHVPGASTLSEKNRTRRLGHVLKRFHRFVLESLGRADVVTASDATGYGPAKKSWRTTDYGLRATQDWVKSHDAVLVPQLLYVQGVTTAGDVHESQVFADLWREWPRTLRPVRSLADSAYAGNANLQAAVDHGATPIHAIKSNAVHRRYPTTPYERLVNFATHWPNRYRELKGRRALAETAISSTKTRFDDRLRCRHPIGRQNEVQAKKTMHNIRVIAMRGYVGSA